MDLYKDINLNNFLKLAEIDFLPNKNLVTSKYLSNKFGIGRNTFGKMIEEYSKGLTITSSSAKKKTKNVAMVFLMFSKITQQMKLRSYLILILSNQISIYLPQLN